MNWVSRVGMLGLIALASLLILVGSGTGSQAKTSLSIPFSGLIDSPILGQKPTAEPGIQLAHHSEAEWREFLRKRRLKRKRLRRERARRAAIAKKRYLRRERLKRQKLRAAKKRRLTKKRRVAVVKRPRKNVVAKAPDLFERQQVKYETREKPGTLIVETSTKYLYYVQKNNTAIRYGVAVGKQGFAWSGTSTIKRKVEWPTWYPPKEMIKRKPKLRKWENGQPGGPDNPLGAAALYLFQGEKDTLYRIHGTNAPSSIGTASSSGCIRMRNEDIQHLYSMVGTGTKVIVR